MEEISGNHIATGCFHNLADRIAARTGSAEFGINVDFRQPWDRQVQPSLRPNAGFAGHENDCICGGVGLEQLGDECLTARLRITLRIVCQCENARRRPGIFGFGNSIAAARSASYR